MKTPVDLRLRREAHAFAFRFACEDCAHFDSGGATCSLSYEPAPRRDALTGAHVELCKTFELG
jgi:hypothetical protein